MSTSPYMTKEEPYSSHRIILEWLREMPQGCTGLDVGAATGIFGRLCQETGLVLDGIEPVTEWAAQAAPWYRNIYSERTEAIPEEQLGGYDFLILGDVLEHLVDPQATLARLARLQPNGCVFIISVPNVANLWVRLNLLVGRFDYQDRGILDRTHLHFYTWKTFREMLEGAGLVVVERKVTPIPLTLVSPFFLRSRLGRGIYRVLYGMTRMMPGLLGYQFVVRGKKREE